jgi:hypothetical protein
MKEKKLQKENDKIEEKINKINNNNDNGFINKINKIKELKNKKKENQQKFKKISEKNKINRDKEIEQLNKKVKKQKELNQKNKKDKINKIKEIKNKIEKSKKQIKKNKKDEEKFKKNKIDLIKKLGDINKKLDKAKKNNESVKKKVDGLKELKKITDQHIKSMKQIKKDFKIEHIGYKYKEVKKWPKSLAGKKGQYKFKGNEGKNLSSRFRTCYMKCMGNPDCRNFSTTKDMCQLLPENRTRIKCDEKDWMNGAYYGDCFTHRLTWKDIERKPKLFEKEFELDPILGNSRSQLENLGKFDGPKYKNDKMYYFDRASGYMSLATNRQFRNRKFIDKNPKQCLVGIEYEFPRAWGPPNLGPPSRSAHKCSYALQLADEERRKSHLGYVAYGFREAKENIQKNDKITPEKKQKELNRINKAIDRCPQWVNRFQVYNSTTGELLGNCGIGDFNPTDRNKKYNCQIFHGTPLTAGQNVIIKTNSCGYTYLPAHRYTKQSWSQKTPNIEPTVLKYKYPCHMKGKLKWVWTDKNSCLGKKIWNLQKI